MGIVRMTKSVKRLLKILEDANQPTSAVELVEQLHKEMNKTTVYRILERLQDEGILHFFRGKDGVKWYVKRQEYTASHDLKFHPHFQCRDCDKIECLHINVSIPAVSNYKIETAQVLLIGQCQDCISLN